MIKSLKQTSISLGLYKPARALHRMIHRTARIEFAGHKKLFSQFVAPGELAFDVGANIGNRTEALLALGARVVAFEPQPECVNEIRARGNDRLIVVEKAVGAKEGTATLHMKAANALSSMVDDWPGDNAGSLPVTVTTPRRGNSQIRRSGILQDRRGRIRNRSPHGAFYPAQEPEP